MKRFELTDKSKTVYGRTVYQIRALTLFGDVNVGDLGGWLEDEKSLSQEGSGWVYDGAVVFKRAKIHGGRIHGGRIWGGEIWGGRIHGGEIHGGEIWGGEIWGGEIWGGEIYGGRIHGGRIHGGRIHGGEIHGGEIYGGRIHGGRIHGGEIHGGEIHGGEIHGGETVTLPAIAICGLKWMVTITDKHMSIGCQTHSFEFWKNSSDKTIDAMEIGALEWWKMHKSILMELIESTRNNKKEG